SITTTVYNTMLVACFGRSDNLAVGVPSGMTERFHAESSSGTSSVDAASESADASQASPGATGSKASTSHTANLSQLIALAPPSSSCGSDTVEPAGTSCTDDDNPCTTDVCNGTAGAPACTHPAGNAGTVCRDSAGQCDVAETCTGTSGACPVDGFASGATRWTGASQGGACDDAAADHCTGSGNACADVVQAAGSTCRDSAGQCDVAETCSGTSGACPADGFASSSTHCTGASQSGACDDNAADHCTGSGNACVDVFQAAGYTCRDSVGQCDVAETCSGTSGACPADGFASSSTHCTGASQSGACGAEARGDGTGSG